jgi:hypothetical protein
MTAGCMGASTPGPMQDTDDIGVIVEPVHTPTIDVCEPIAIPDIAFPRQEPVEGPREVMEAELVGVLVLQDGCLRVDSLYEGEESYLPIWPPEFTLDLDNDTLVILDGDGILVGRVGEEIFMGGGTGRLESMPECVRQHLPINCNGPFWTVGEGVRLNVNEDSELIRINRITTADRTAILLIKEPILDEWVEEPGMVSGILRVYAPHRCPRIISESGMTDYLLIWPPDYSLEITDKLVEISNREGKLVAREGDDLVVSGGPIPHSWGSDQYRRLYYEVPGDCFGPYWIVGE